MAAPVRERLVAEQDQRQNPAYHTSIFHLLWTPRFPRCTSRSILNSTREALPSHKVPSIDRTWQSEDGSIGVEDPENVFSRESILQMLLPDS